MAHNTQPINNPFVAIGHPFGRELLIHDPQHRIVARQQARNLDKRNDKIRNSRKKVRQNIAPVDDPQFTRVRADPDAIVQAMKQAGLSCYALPESQGIFVGTSKLIVHPLADGTHARTMRQVLHAYGF